MIFKRLKQVHLKASPPTIDKIGLLQYFEPGDELTFRVSMRLAAVNAIVRANREALLALLHGGGEAFLGQEVTKSSTAVNQSYREAVALFTGIQPQGEFDYTLMTIKPKSLAAAVKIAHMFGWDTNFDAAEFIVEHDGVEGFEREQPYLVYTEERFLEIHANLE